MTAADKAAFDAIPDTYVLKDGDTVTGSIYNIYEGENGQPVNQFWGRMAGNDFWAIRAGGEVRLDPQSGQTRGPDDSGYLEIATADNATEPIYVAQYMGEHTADGELFATRVRRAALLDENGVTRFPVGVVAPYFDGSASRLGTVGVGSATNPIYLDAGTPRACTYSLNKSVPADAAFTDTTYSVATQSADGLMSAADKIVLDAIPTKYVLKTGDTLSGSLKVSSSLGTTYWGALADNGAIICKNDADSFGAWLNGYTKNYKVGLATWSNNTDYVYLYSYTPADISNHTTTPNNVLRWDASTGNLYTTGTVTCTKINGHTIDADVPSNAAFTDTVYTHPSYTARTGKPTANATPGFGGTFTVSQISSDATGHVTSATDRTITIPSATATQSANGLMSSADKTELDKLGGNIDLNRGAPWVSSGDTSRYLRLFNVEYSGGASLYVYGKDYSGANAGQFRLIAHNGTTYKELVGAPNGALTWGGNNVLTDAVSYALSSDLPGLYGAYNFSETTVPTATFTNLGSFTPTKTGKWLVVVNMTFTANATGYRRVVIANSATGNYPDRFRYKQEDGAGANTQVIQLVWISNFTSISTVYFNAYQNSGSNITCSGGYRVYYLGAS